MAQRVELEEKWNNIKKPTKKKQINAKDWLDEHCLDLAEKKTKIRQLLFD